MNDDRLVDRQRILGGLRASSMGTRIQDNACGSRLIWWYCSWGCSQSLDGRLNVCDDDRTNIEKNLWWGQGNTVGFHKTLMDPRKKLPSVCESRNSGLISAPGGSRLDFLKQRFCLWSRTTMMLDQGGHMISFFCSRGASLNVERYDADRQDH